MNELVQNTMTRSSLQEAELSGHCHDPQSGVGLAEDCGVTVHAVLPPPVTGMTLCTEAMATAMGRRVPVRRYNWSNGSPRITPWFRLAKALRALMSPLRILCRSRPHHGVFYMPCNAGWAVLFNVLAIGSARLRGYRCVLHHHYYRYVEHFQWRIKLLADVVGPSGVHLVLCPDMERRMRATYGPKLPIAIVPSTVQLLLAGFEPEPSKSGDTLPRPPFRIGHISNLQMAKGLDTVVEVLRVLRGKGRDVQLVLAGPLQSDRERKLIEAAQHEFGSAIDYRGPVYDEQKRQFFRDVHVKLFPTRYPDVQPLVITESFAFGCPVLSYGRACIPGMMGAASEWSISTSDDFVGRAVCQIERWMSDPSAYVDASRRARERFDELMAEAQQSLGDFLHWVCREPDHDFVRRGAEDSATSQSASG